MVQGAVRRTLRGVSEAGQAVSLIRVGRRLFHGPFCRGRAGCARPDHPAGSGAASGADCVIYAGSLVNPALLGLCRDSARIYDSARMTLEQVLEVVERAEAAGQETVRLHTGDPCLYGAVREQMDALDRRASPGT